MVFNFDDCEMLHQTMKFTTCKDFCENRKILKKRYEKLKGGAKRFYMWYVYANIYMDLKFKNIIWDYLNNNLSEERLLNMMKFYRIK